MSLVYMELGHNLMYVPLNDDLRYHNMIEYSQHLSHIGYPVAQIIELNDFWTFDNFSWFVSAFEVYFDIYKPFATEWDEKWGDHLIFT